MFAQTPPMEISFCHAEIGQKPRSVSVTSSFHGSPSQAHAGAWAEENTKDEKEEAQGGKNTKQKKIKRDVK